MLPTTSAIEHRRCHPRAILAGDSNDGAAVARLAYRVQREVDVLGAGFGFVPGLRSV